MIRPVDALLEFLAAEQARGISHVHLDDGARDALRELHFASKPGAAIPAPKMAEDSPVVPTESAPTIVSASLSIVGSTRVEQLASLHRQAENWGAAKSLGSLRETMVFAAGNPEARLMLIGEAPGYHEEREGKPFAGSAGEKLDGILKAMGLSREDVYISNLVKFRPAAPRQTTNNRKPTPEEIAAFLPFVRAEIEIIQPECIVALGETAAEGLLGLTGNVTSMTGRWHSFEGTPARATYHPSHLLQSNGGNQTKRQLWEDMLAVMEKLDLPISEKQRGFFLEKS